MILLKLMLPWFKQRWHEFVLALFLATTTLLAGTALFTVAGWFITGAFLAGTILSFNLFVPSALVRGLSFLRIGSRYAERITGHAATLKLLANIRTSLFAHIACMSTKQLARYQDGDLVASLIDDIDALDNLYLRIVAPVFAASCTALLFSIAIGWHVPLLGWAVLIIMTINVVVVPWTLSIKSRKCGVHIQEANAQARSMVHYTVASHVDLTVFAAQVSARQRFNELSFSLAQKRKHLSIADAWGQFTQQISMGLLLLAILLIGLPAYTAGVIGAPLWIGFLLGAMGLFEVIVPLIRGATHLGITGAAAARIHKVISINQKSSTGKANTITTGAQLPKVGAIEFKNVSFSYVVGANVLTNLNLRIEQGTIIAIQGISGSGKSTLLSLLMRIYDPDDGVISYGGMPLTNVTQDQVFKRFTFLSQSSPVFIGTIRDNLLIANPAASDPQLWQALCNAGLASFVSTLEQGLNTWVGEGGRQLSVGQVRRMCLARALLTSASVWVLDEPTAGLDAQAQYQFFSDLRRMAQGRSVVIATHANLPSGAVDRVYNLKNTTGS